MNIINLLKILIKKNETLIHKMLLRQNLKKKINDALK